MFKEFIKKHKKTILICGAVFILVFFGAVTCLI